MVARKLTFEGSPSQFGISPSAEILDARSLALDEILHLFTSLDAALTVKQVAQFTTISESLIWAKCDESNPNYDPRFPQPASLPNTKRTVWSLRAVQAYLRDVFVPVAPHGSSSASPTEMPHPSCANVRMPKAPPVFEALKARKNGGSGK
jgi:predicted DNA-binding transcriptional regulator AlpA